MPACGILVASDQLNSSPRGNDLGFLEEFSPEDFGEIIVKRGEAIYAICLHREEMICIARTQGIGFHKGNNVKV